MLAAVTVSNDSDLVNAPFLDIASLVFFDDGGDGISLREALVAANNTSGADTITFDAALTGSTILLGGTQLSITDDITITGLGADEITIDAQGASRVMRVTSNATADISGLTFTGGNADRGGGLRSNYGTTTLLRAVVIQGNTATHVGGDAGGGVLSVGDLTINESLITGNTAAGSGGGVWSNNLLTITSSTISGNMAGFYGGGVSGSGFTTIRHSTITGNSAGYGGGGGVGIYGGTLDHTIVANNTTTASGNDVLGSVTANWSLIEDTTGATISGANNITGVDPMLDVLADNGGPTFAHDLLPGSPALDAGDPGAVAGVGTVPAFDQRGSFLRVWGTAIDIGAVEQQPDVFLVDTNVDESDGDFSPGDLSLREALEITNVRVGPDLVTFDAALAGSTILLAGTQLEISDDVTLTGLGADLLMIDAQGTSRVMLVSGGVAEISGLTLTGGSAEFGGGLVNYPGASTTLRAVVIQGNMAMGASPTLKFGGGIGNAGELTVIDSTISGNSSAHSGGGIHSNAYGTANITSSSIWGNTAVVGGGVSGTNLTITNSTVSGNTATDVGGGVIVDSTTTIQHSTIANNLARFGGGIYATTAGGTLSHTIVVTNTATFGPVDGDDIKGSITANFSQIGTTLGAMISGANNILENQFGLQGLSYNGGPTRTRALSISSPALNAGDPSIVDPPDFDQRGAPFARVFGAAIDIGAYERVPDVIVVDVAVDESDGDYSIGDLSLREAIDIANASAGADMVAFDVALAGSTISLVLGQLEITDSTTITGLGADQLTVSGGGLSRVFQFGGDGANQYHVSDLTIADGDAGVAAGGGIFMSDADDTLTITRTTIRNNVANGGGGLSVDFGTLNVVDSAIIDNEAVFNGSGLVVFNAAATLTNVTVSGSPSAGPAVQNLATTASTLTIQHSTFANHAGVAISNFAFDGATATTSYEHSIFAGNAGANFDNVALGAGVATLTSLGYNIADDASGSLTAAGDMPNTDPMLALLANNGGPTKNHALLPSSPALDAGDPGFAAPPDFDQRGAPFVRVADGTIDIGSYEAQTFSFLVDTAVDESDGDFSIGDLSLREALERANTNPGADTVTFDAALAGSTISLVLGHLTISDDVTLTGLGSGDLTIDAQGTSRVMTVGGSATTNISGLTLTGGTADRGGGLFNSLGTTTSLTGVVIQGNTATTSSSKAGGGIWNSGELTITDSTISGNMTTAGFGSGAGIWNDNLLSITRSTISGNMSNGDGGGIYSASGGDVTITDSTISGNTASVNAGGVWANGTALSISGSTISGNTSNGYGGVFVSYGMAAIRHSTIAGNLGATGGGLNAYYSGIVTLEHTILANNTAGTGPDVHGTVTANWSLIEDTTGAMINGANNTTGMDPMLDVLADNGGPTETHALLAGSPALAAGDPLALAGVGNVPLFDQRGAGFPRVVGGTTIDIGALERLPNVIVVDTNLDESDGDYALGDLSVREAIELANADSSANAISFDAALAGSTISLVLGQLTISGDLTLTGLGSGNLTIDAQGASRVMSVTNNATADISGLTLTGGNADEGGGLRNDAGTTTSLSGVVIQVNTASVDGGGVWNSGELTVVGSTISGNTVVGSFNSGGGFWSDAVLSISQSTISDNAARDGGGLYVIGGNLTITDSTISGNTASAPGDDFGGGLVMFGGDHSISRSTISGNSADWGGGVHVTGNLTITDSAIWGNTAVRYGGGVSIGGSSNVTTIAGSTISGNTASSGGGLVSVMIFGRVVIEHSTITLNTATGTIPGGDGVLSAALYTDTEVRSSIIAGNSGGEDVSFANPTFPNPFISLGHNLIGGGNAAGAFIGLGDQVGADPTLGPLADNGGPTETHALPAGSPAIDAGDPAAAAGVGDVPEFDQRGAPFARMIDGDGGAAIIDIGAYEVQTDIVPPTVTAVVRNGGGQNFGELVTLAITLSEDVSATIDKLDLVLENTTTATAVDLTAVLFSYDDFTNTATWDFSAATVEVGFHTATLSAAGITDTDGNPLDGNNDGTGGDDFVTSEVGGLPLLVALPGDINLDGEIDSGDIQTILGANSFNNPPGPPPPIGPWTWFEGDFNGDGYVTSTDIQLILATAAFGDGPYVATTEPATDSSLEPIEFSAPGVSAPLTVASLQPTSTTVITSAAPIAALIRDDRAAALDSVLAANPALGTLRRREAQPASAFYPPPASNSFLVPEPTQITQHRAGAVPRRVDRLESVEWHDGVSKDEFNITGVLVDRRSAATVRGEIDTLATSLHVRWEEHVWDDALLSLVGRDDSAGGS